MKIKVVFLKDSKWGKRGEIKEVAPALFKNVLKPQKIAAEYWSAEAKNLLNKINKKNNNIKNK